MPADLKSLKNRVGSVKNIQKITGAMQMVAAARLRRAELRIEALRPYAGAVRRMARQASAAAGNVPNLPVLTEHESVDKVGILLVTGDRGLAGAFNSRSSAPASRPPRSTASRARRSSSTRPAAAVSAR
jgi:F-type H+-transporting ATPase subunit gamma